MSTFEVTWSPDDDGATTASESFDERDDAERFATALERRGLDVQFREYMPTPAGWGAKGRWA